MRARVEATIRSHQGSRSDRDSARVYEGRVPVQKDSFSELDVAAVVYVDWRRHPGVLREEFCVFFWSGCQRRQ